MASSIIKAQSTLSCQLCDNPKVIKWKCKDCAMLMCGNCKERVHPRFKLSETHTVISIKDVKKDEGDISIQLGSLQVSKPVISSLLSAYTSNFPAFHKIQYSGNDTVYCSYNIKDNEHKFFIIRLLKESIKVLKELDIDCTDFSLGSKDKIYYGKYRGTELKVFSSDDGVSHTVLSTSPMLIMCIHINKNNELILGLREQGSPFPITEFCSRRITVFDENNKRKLTFEYDKKGKQLFSYIWRISTDLYNTIYAIDQFENFEGRLVALERSGGMKFIYEGCSSVNTLQTPFKPMDFVVTKTNIIIISDYYKNSLHALTTKGELIGLQTVKDLAIEYPLSLCLDSEGFLLIGCSSGVNEANDAKIHVAKIAF